MLTKQLEVSEKLRHETDEKVMNRILWVGGFVGTLFTVLTGLMGLFINSRIKDPEEYRENLRAHLFQEVEASRKEVIAHTDSELAKTREQLREVQNEHTKTINDLFAKARAEAERFRTENSEMVSALKNLTSLGQPSPGEKPEAETLYYLAEQSRAEAGAEGRARGLRYLRRLADADIPANPPVLHNAAVLAKEYDSQETSIRLFRRAYEASQGSERYGATLAHELALAHNRQESLQLFEELLRKRPADDRIFHFYIDALRALELYQEAQTLLAEKDELFKDSAKVQREWADLLASMGRHREALEKAKRATVLDPADEIAWAYCARIAMLLGDLDTAKDSLQHAISLADETSPRLPGHFRRLADVFRLQGDPENAKANYKASIIAAQSPSRSVMWLNLLETPADQQKLEAVSEGE